MWKKSTEFEFKATWTINEKIQTEERNPARFSLWHGAPYHRLNLAWFLCGACEHVACPAYVRSNATNGNVKQDRGGSETSDFTQNIYILGKRLRCGFESWDSRFKS